MVWVTLQQFKNFLRQSEMNKIKITKQTTYDNFLGQLLGYNILGNKIIYLTNQELVVVKPTPTLKRQCIKVKGTTITNFTLSKKGMIALLYTNQTLEVRKIDKLTDVYCKFHQINILPAFNYPRIKWDQDQIYLLYQDSLEILNVKDEKRRGFTDILVDYQNEQIMDMSISSIMDTEKVVTLQLKNRLILTIIPIPVTEIQIPEISHCLCLGHPLHLTQSKRQYLAIVVSDQILRIYNFINLKQIAEVQLHPTSKQFVEIQSDLHCQYLLVRYIHKDNLEITRNIILRVNYQYYYCETNNYFEEKEPFFLNALLIDILHNLTILANNNHSSNKNSVVKQSEQVNEKIELCYFTEGKLICVECQYKIPSKASNNGLQCKMGQLQWHQILEWKQILTSYMEITGTIQQQPLPLTVHQEDRQLYQHQLIKQDFNNIVRLFTEQLETNNTDPLNQNQIEKLWNQYLLQYAKNHNYLISSLNLFKIEIQKNAKENQIRHIQKSSENKNQKKQNLTKKQDEQKVQTTNNQHFYLDEVLNREKRMNSKIQLKKLEIQKEKKKISKLSEEEVIKKQEQQYQKFVAQFLVEKAKKQKEEKINSQRRKAEISKQNIQTLKMNECDKLSPMKIDSKNIEVKDKSLQKKDNLSIKCWQNPNTKQQNGSERQEQEQHEQQQLKNDTMQQQISKQQIINAYLYIDEIRQKLRESLSPLETSCEELINKMMKIQQTQFERWKQCEERVKEQSEIKIEEVVAACCQKMFADLNKKVRSTMTQVTKKIYHLEDKSYKFREDLIQKYKEFVTFQVKNRVHMFHLSRKQMELNLQQVFQKNN